MSDKKIKITYRKPKDAADLEACIKFTDDWLAGRKRSAGDMRAGDDYFVTPTQHKNYLKSAYVLLAFNKKKLIGWAVKWSKTNTLFHLLIDPDYRGLGIGAKLLKILDPDIVRSKSDQMTGDPAAFYEKHGYISGSEIFVGKKRNIQFMVRKNE